MSKVLTVEGVAASAVQDGGRSLVLEISGIEPEADGEHVRLLSWREHGGEHSVLGPLAGRRLRVVVEDVDGMPQVGKLVSLPTWGGRAEEPPITPWSDGTVDGLVARARELIGLHGANAGWALLLAEVLDPSGDGGLHGETHLLGLALATAVTRLARQDTAG